MYRLPTSGQTKPPRQYQLSSATQLAAPVQLIMHEQTKNTEQRYCLPPLEQTMAHRTHPVASITQLAAPIRMQNKKPAQPPAWDEAADSQSRPSSRSRSGSAERRTTPAKAERFLCVFCDGEHKPIRCKIPLSEKQDIIRNKKRYYNCLNDKHFVKDCDRWAECFNCKGDHHPSLC